MGPKRYADPAQDIPIKIANGTHPYQRVFTVPADAPVGEHKLGTNLWLGVAGKSNYSTLLWQAQVTIKVV